MPKIRLLTDGPFKYSAGVYKKGDVFEVGGRAATDYCSQGIAELVEDEAPAGSATSETNGGDVGDPITPTIPAGEVVE